MTARALLRRLQRAGIIVRLDAEGLVVEAPPGALGGDDRSRLAEHASEIADLLAQPGSALPSVPHADNPILWGMDWLAARDERAAIMQYDAGLPREEAERRATDEVRVMRERMAAPQVADPAVQAAIAEFGPAIRVTVRLPDGEVIPVVLARGGKA